MARSIRDHKVVSEYLKVCHVNAQSLTAHLDEFRLNFLKTKWDVICISETWLDHSIDSGFISLPEYTLFRKDRIGKRGGGVGVYVHNSLKAKLITHSPENYEGKPEFIFIEVKSGISKILIGCVYRPPKKGFLTEFEAAFLNLYSLYDNIIVLGDFNTDLCKSTVERDLLESVVGACNLQLVSLNPTYHTPTSDTLLDLILVDDVDKVAKEGQYPVPFLSWHDLVYIYYKIPLSSFTPRMITYRCFRGFNIDTLNEELSKIDWSSLFSEVDINNKVLLLNSIILEFYDRFAPWRTVRVTHPPAPWLSDEIRHLINLRNDVRGRYRSVRLPHLLTRFKQLRNRVKTLVRNAKSDYFRKVFKDAKNSSSMWSALRRLGIGTKNNAEIHIHPDVLNNHFASASLGSPALAFDPPSQQIHENDDKFYFAHVTHEMILRAFSKSKSNSLGSDGIPLNFIKNSLGILMPTIMHIFDASLQSCFFPGVWKHAIITPIPKCSNPQEANHYRPISILCSLSKILETVVSCQLLEFINGRKIFHPCQSGYRTNHNTQTSLLDLVDNIRGAMDNKEITILVSFDFTKAFDCIDHRALLSKLFSLGLSDSSVRWFESYLTGRTQCVSVRDGGRSQWIPCSSGVPQGSVLGPLLFCLFINDLPSVLMHCKCHLYADDFNIYLSFPRGSITEAVNRVNKDIDSIHRWSLMNGLVLNADKTKAIFFGTRGLLASLPEMPPLWLEGRLIPYETQVGVLGVFLDSKLTWKTQCESVCLRNTRALGQLRRIRESLSFDARRLVVQSLCFPHFDYCGALFSDLSGEQLTRLQRSMNAGIRFITGISRYEHITPAYRSLGIMPMKTRIDFIMAKILRGVLKTGEPAYLRERFLLIGDDYRRTGRTCEHDLSIPKYRTTIYERSFTISSALLWNSLPLEVRRMELSADTFRLRLSEFLMKRV